MLYHHHYKSISLSVINISTIHFTDELICNSHAVFSRMIHTIIMTKFVISIIILIFIIRPTLSAILVI